jgi:hypothetical protein
MLEILDYFIATDVELRAGTAKDWRRGGKSIRAGFSTRWILQEKWTCATDLFIYADHRHSCNNSDLFYSALS